MRHGDILTWARHGIRAELQGRDGEGWWIYWQCYAWNGERWSTKIQYFPTAEAAKDCITATLGPTDEDETKDTPELRAYDLADQEE